MVGRWISRITRFRVWRLKMMRRLNGVGDIFAGLPRCTRCIRMPRLVMMNIVDRTEQETRGGTAEVAPRPRRDAHSERGCVGCSSQEATGRCQRIVRSAGTSSEEQTKVRKQFIFAARRYLASYPGRTGGRTNRNAGGAS